MLRSNNPIACPILALLWGAVMPVLLPVIASCQRVDSGSSAFAKGEIQASQKAIQQLLRLSVNGSSIGMDREWGAINRADQLAEETRKLVDRGMNERIAARLAEQLVPGGLQSHPLIHAFAQTRPANGSFSQSGTSRKWNMSFRGQQLSGNLKFDANAVEIQFQEHKGDRRVVHLQDDNEGYLSLQYSGSDFLVKLTQSKTGGIELVRDWNGKREVIEAVDFNEFQQKNAQLVNTWLIPVLEHAGFDMPLAITSPVVKKAVLERLVILLERSDQEFDDLINDLDADDFATRDQATQRLRDRLDIWSDDIQQTLQSRTLSAEAKNRLEILMLKSSNGNSVTALVKANALLQDSKYLISLFDSANEQETDALNRHLKMLTGKEYSTAQEWQEFLQQSPMK